MSVDSDASLAGLGPRSIPGASVRVKSTNVMASDSESGGGPVESESEKPAGPGWGLYYDISANGSPAEHVPLEQITEA
jgi:hypothetical protein